MPSTPQIHLDVRNFSSPAPWVDVVVGSQTYSYLYTGGDDGHGCLVASVGQGRDTAPIQLDADQRYQMGDCVFSDDFNNQLSWNGGARAGTIVDSNTQVETAKYTVQVTDTGNGNCTVPCDPQIINR